MAKASSKTVSAPIKKSVAKSKAKASLNIEQVTEEILSKLKSLEIEQQLQADLEWCLGSYRYDQNDAGLREVLGISLITLKQAHAKKTKGITSTLITNIEKVLN